MMTKILRKLALLSYLIFSLRCLHLTKPAQFASNGLHANYFSSLSNAKARINHKSVWCVVFEQNLDASGAGSNRRVGLFRSSGLC